MRKVVSTTRDGRVDRGSSMSPAGPIPRCTDTDARPLPPEEAGCWSCAGRPKMPVGAFKQPSPHSWRRRGTSPCAVAQRVSYTTKVYAHKIKDLPVAHGCRAAAGLPPPSPLDDRRAMVSWERMAQREQETRTWGFVAWSLAVCAGYRAKPVMDAYIYVVYVECSRSWQTTPCALS
jgi:hypothetical protein